GWAGGRHGHADRCRARGACGPLTARGSRPGVGDGSSPARRPASEPLLHGGDKWAFFGALVGGLGCALVGATVGVSPGRELGTRWGGNVTDATWTTRESSTLPR